jgi:hypothetical protein
MKNSTLNVVMRRLTASLFVGLLKGIALVFALAVATAAQSPSELATTHKWLQSKSGDRAVMASLGASQNDPCDPRNETGPYDPLPCINSQKNQWIAVQKVARTDPQAAQGVRKTIDKIVEGLTANEKQWRSLSPAMRDQEIAVREEIADSVRKSGGSVTAGLEAVTQDSGRSQQARSAAKRMLTVSKDQGGIGWLFGCLICYCVTAEGCPCCSYGVPRDILQKKPVGQ